MMLLRYNQICFYKNHCHNAGGACTPDTWCRHEIVTCTASRKIKNCGECGDYPCNKILAAVENTQRHQPDCRKCCTEAEFAIMEKAFF